MTQTNWTVIDGKAAACCLIAMTTTHTNGVEGATVTCPKCDTEWAVVDGKLRVTP